MIQDFFFFRFHTLPMYPFERLTQNSMFLKHMGEKCRGKMFSFSRGFYFVCKCMTRQGGEICCYSPLQCTALSSMLIYQIGTISEVCRSFGRLASIESSEQRCRQLSLNQSTLISGRLRIICAGLS